MKITYDFHEFFRTVGIVNYLPRVKQLGLTTDDITATFYRHDVDELLDFCAKNPEYHVVTYICDGIMVNRYDERGFSFALADGYRNPHYMLNGKHFFEWYFPQKKT